MSSSLSLLLLLCAMAATSQAGLMVSKLRASKLSSYIGTPDAYVKVSSGATYLGKTATRNNNRNPWWEEDFHHFRAKVGDVLKLEVYDDDFLIDDLMGSCQRPIKVGVWNDVQCYLKKDGILYYSYTFTE